MGLFGSKKLTEEERLERERISKQILEDKKTIDAGYFVIHEDYDGSRSKWLKHYKRACDRIKIPFVATEWEDYWIKNENNRQVVVLKFDSVINSNLFYFSSANMNNTMYKDVNSDEVYFSYEIYDLNKITNHKPQYKSLNLLQIAIIWQTYRIMESMELSGEKQDDLMGFIEECVVSAYSDIGSSFSKKMKDVHDKEFCDAVKKETISNIGSIFRKETRQYKKNSSSLGSGTLFTPEEKKECLDKILEILKDEKKWFFTVSQKRLDTVIKWDAVEAVFDMRTNDEPVRELVPFNPDKINELDEKTKMMVLLGMKSDYSN